MVIAYRWWHAELLVHVHPHCWCVFFSYFIVFRELQKNLSCGSCSLFKGGNGCPKNLPNFFFFSCLILSAICRPDLSPAFLLFFIFFFGGVSSSCFLFFTFSSYFSFSSKSVISSECSLSEHPGLKPDMDFIFPAILKRPELMVHPHGLVTYQSPVIGFTLIGGKF